MQERRKRAYIKRRKKEIFVNRLLIISIIALVISTFLFFRQSSKISKLKNEYQNQIKTQEALGEKVEELKKQIKGVNSLEYIEKIARQELGMIKEGESVYIEEDNENQGEQGDD